MLDTLDTSMVSDGLLSHKNMTCGGLFLLGSSVRETSPFAMVDTVRLTARINRSGANHQRRDGRSDGLPDPDRFWLAEGCQQLDSPRAEKF